MFIKIITCVVPNKWVKQAYNTMENTLYFDWSERKNDVL